jgi:hypothetical protein
MGCASARVKAPVIIVVARVVTAPLRRAWPLTLPAVAVVVVKHLAMDREFILPVDFEDLSEGALPRVALLSIMIHGGGGE